MNYGLDDLQRELVVAELAVHAVRRQLLNSAAQLRLAANVSPVNLAAAELLESHAKAAVAGVANTTGVLARVKTILKGEGNGA